MENELLKNWVSTELLEICKVSTGKKDANHADSNGEYKFFTCALEQTTSTTYSFQGESIIIPGNGNIGYVFFYNGKFEAYQRTYVLNDIKIVPKFLYYHFRCFWKLRTVDNLFGTTVQYVKIGNFQSYEISFPSFVEQNRIVAKLDTLFAQLESIKNSIKKFNTISNKFTYTCLVDSKLQKFYPREKIGQFLEEGKERIGANWKSHRLIGVSSKQGIIDLRVGQKETFEKYKIVRPGDFIYNTMRVNIGSIALYNGTVDALTSPDYVVFRVSKFLSPQLLLNFLKSEQGLLEIGANTKGSVRARLYFSALSEVRMPIAPLKIQKLAEEFLKVFSLNLSILNYTMSAKLERLSKLILNKAFKGELTEQLESDGDARDLLKEIKALKIKKK